MESFRRCEVPSYDAALAIRKQNLFPSLRDEWRVANAAWVMDSGPNPWDAETTGSQHLCLQGGSVGSRVDLKYSDGVRESIAPARATVYSGDNGSFLDKGYVEEKHIYGSTTQGGQTRNNWAVGQEHDFCREKYAREAAVQRHSVSLAPPAPDGLRIERKQRSTARLSWSAVDEQAGHSGSARVGTQCVTYELECDNGLNKWKTIYTGKDTSFLSPCLPPSAQIQYRVRAISAIKRPGPWSSVLQLQRQLVQEKLQHQDSWERAPARWVWPAVSPGGDEAGAGTHSQRQ